MYTVEHWWGKHERNLPEAALSLVLAELANADQEHPDCSLSHESGWTLSYHRTGLLVFENVEDANVDRVRHMKNMSSDTVLDLWSHLSRGEIAHVTAQPWEDRCG